MLPVYLVAESPEWAWRRPAVAAYLAGGPADTGVGDRAVLFDHRSLRALTGIASAGCINSEISGSGAYRSASFNIMAFLSAMVYIASLFLIRKLHEDGAVNSFKMMRVLVTENAIRQVVQSYTLGRPLSEESRVSKLQNLRGSMVTDDLVADLYSPSSRVRDEAVNHLSKLDKATPEAITELLKIATDPDLGMRVPALRALGRLRARETLPTRLAAGTGHRAGGVAGGSVLRWNDWPTRRRLRFCATC